MTASAADAEYEPRRKRRLLLLVGIASMIIVVAGLVWIVVTALLARSDLRRAQADLPQLRSALLAGDVTRAHVLSNDIRERASSARRLMGGPAWWVAAHIPYVGTPLQESRAVAAGVNEVAGGALPALVDVSGTISNPSLRQGSGVNLALLGQLQPLTERAVQAIGKARTLVDGTDHHSWLATVDNARSSLSDQLAQLDGDLSGAQRAVRIVLPMLGRDGPQRIFIAFENEAEARGLGGLPAAYAIVDTNHGQMHFAEFGNDTALTKSKANVDFGPGYQATYGQADPTGTFRNSDISPNFPYAAQIWAKMWESHTGQKINAAIAVDPTALSYFLTATGPAVAQDGTKVTAANVVSLTESKQYSRFSTRPQRQAWVVAIAKAVSNRLINTHAVRAVAKAAAHAAGERRFVVWSANPAIQSDLVAANYAGTMGGQGEPVSSFAVINAAGSKLDYYLDRTMTYRRDGCGVGSTATATLILTNNAPRSGLPGYVTKRADKPPPGAEPGDDHVIVAYYFTSGARATSVEVNGDQHTSLNTTDAGLGVIQLDLELKIGVRNTVTISTAEPTATEPVDIIAQPLVRPMQVVSTGTVCGLGDQ